VWIVTNTLNVPPEAADHVVEAFRRNEDDMKTFEGFLGVEIWRREDGTLLAVTRWTSKAAFEKYPQSEAFRRHHAGAQPSAGGPPQVLQYESVL
jgi:heme-degrading monooxygenase HmoA